MSFIWPRGIAEIMISTKNPKDDFSVNIGGALERLMALRESKKLKRFVYPSSVCIYGNPYRLPINEDDRFNVLSPYSVSKLGGEN